MVRYIASLVLIAVLASACDRNDAPCSTENPLEELAWLKELAEENETHASNGSAGYYIYQGRYKSKDVFINDICCPQCMVIVQVYNCNGEVLEGVTPDDVSAKVLIWQSEESPCPRR